MASPPYRSPAASPPNPAHTTIPNPRKRPQLVMPNHPNPLKRRKVSSFSTSASSAHPLRQTSFPPEESAVPNDARSPSVDSDYTAITGRQSVGTSAIGGRKGKGKRKKIEEKDGTAKRTTDGRSATGGLEEDEEEGDGDVDGDGDDGVVEDGTKVDRAAEKKKLV